MQQLIDLWMSLDARRRLAIGLSTVLMFAAVLALTRMATNPTMMLLYSGLESSNAGDVVQALETRDVAYDVRGDSIFVEAARRDELRMTLASEGLPMLSGQGYELLDSLSGFGTTSQMFDAAYWRAKEGELARTIVAGPQFRSARVHISKTASQPFTRSDRATASVTVTAADGGVTSGHSRALQYLVASAVAGLVPEDVSVIDGRNGTVISEDSGAQASSTASDLAVEMKRNVERILEARVGIGRAVVEVNVDTVSESESITERRFDPEGRVAISSETEERSTNANDTRGGSVTVASNLPEGDAGAGDNTSSSQNSETRERINYEVSETTREVLRAPGSIRRVSTAVLIDGITTTNPDTGETEWTPREAAELADLRDLIASTVGLDETRGDTLTVKTLQFTAAPVAGSEAGGFALQNLGLDLMQLIQSVVLLIAVAVIALFVVRPILAQPASNAQPPALPPAQPQGSAAQLAATANPQAAPTPVLTGEIDDSDISPPLAQATGNPTTAGQVAELTDLRSGDQEDPVARLRNLISDRREESVEILKGWIEGEEEKAT